ncbi:MAG: hypothetical protein KBG28_08330 [Kofleriaceae bacterium]|nr:hypothetical protein [Kofleriaceae bacterium]
MKLSTALALPVAFLLGCGGDDGVVTPDAPANVNCPTTGRYLPLATGNSWTYQVTDVGTGAMESKTQTVGAVEDVGGVKAGTMAFRVSTTKVGGAVTSWQQDTGEAIVRHRETDAAGAQMTEEVYTPSKLRVDESAAHTAMGATWTITYDEAVTNTATNMTVTVGKTENWRVEMVDDVITVGAGSYCALRVGRTSSSAGGSTSDKVFWFVRGVGKIREQGTDQIEDLQSFTVN